MRITDVKDAFQKRIPNLQLQGNKKKDKVDFVSNVHTENVTERVIKSEHDQSEYGLYEEYEAVRPDTYDTEKEYISTYGQTATNQFQKEHREKQFHIDKRPSLLTFWMVILVLFTELVIHCHVITTFYWMTKVRKVTRVPQAMDVDRKFESTREPNLKLTTAFPSEETTTFEQDKSSNPPWSMIKSDLMNDFQFHLLLYDMAFTYVFPQIILFQIIFDFLSDTKKLFISLFWKTLAFSLFCAAWHYNEISVYSEMNMDFGAHANFATACKTLFVIFMFLATIQLVTKFYWTLLDWKYVGCILKFMLSDNIMVSLHHLLTISGLLAVLTGFYAYVFVITQLHQHQFSDDIGFESNEIMWIEFVIVTLTAEYITVTITYLYKHYIVSHKHTITVDQFRDFFLPFKSIYEEPKESYKKMPRVTSAIRMG